MSSSSGLAELVIGCDGSAHELAFLVEEKHVQQEQDFRRLISADGFIVYRIPTGTSQLERVSYCASQVAYRLEYSSDGEKWHTLVQSPTNVNGDKFGVASCGFPADVLRESGHSEHAYFRFSAGTNEQGAYPAIRWLKLAVSGFPIPEHFRRPTWSTRIRAVLALLAPRGMVLVGVGAVVLGRKRWKTPWSLFACGGLLWVVSVAAKAGFALLLNGPVYRLLHAALPTVPANVVFWCYIGLLTGLFECGIFLIFAKQIRNKAWEWTSAASLGVGFGATEAVVVGIGAAVATAMNREPVVNIDVTSSLIGPMERVIALLIHVASVMMVIYAITQQRWRWFAAAFVIKSGVDALAAFALMSGTMKMHPWCVELLLFAPIACGGAIALAILARSWHGTAAGPQAN